MLQLATKLQSKTDVAKKALQVALSRYNVGQFRNRLQIFIDVQKKGMRPPFLEQVEADLAAGKYLPMDYLTLTYSDLSNAFDGTDEEWRQIYEAQDRNVHKFMKEKRNRFEESVNRSLKRPRKLAEQLTTDVQDLEYDSLLLLN